LRKFALLVAGVALSVGTLAACIGPPPPSTDPHDVLVVGDSVSFSFGCVLGDTIPGFDPSGCPVRNGYTTHNESSGACTITPGTVLAYTGGTAAAPNCDTAPDAQNRTWAQAADQFTPKVVVINTAGWEVVDRWINCCNAPPDAQWGGPTNGPPNDAYHTAAGYYSNELYQAIQMFRSKGAKVLVANAPYIAPPQPEPPPDQVPAGLGCTWWEPYPNSAPMSSGPDCTGNATAGSGGAWRPPPGSGVSYRSSRTKVDQFNNIVNGVLTNPDPSFGFGSDPNVKSFNFKNHFNGGPSNAYSDYVCPPPNDVSKAPINTLDFHSGVPAGNMAFQCDNGNGPNTPLNPWNYAILARAPDKGHLSVAGEFQVLQPYIEPCVQSMLGIGGDPTKCS
jgi:hypothetical protein